MISETALSLEAKKAKETLEDVIYREIRGVPIPTEKLWKVLILMQEIKKELMEIKKAENEKILIEYILENFTPDIDTTPIKEGAGFFPTVMLKLLRELKERRGKDKNALSEP